MGREKTLYRFRSRGLGHYYYKVSYPPRRHRGEKIAGKSSHRATLYQEVIAMVRGKGTRSNTELKGQEAKRTSKAPGAPDN